MTLTERKDLIERLEAMNLSMLKEDHPDRDERVHAISQAIKVIKER